MKTNKQINIFIVDDNNVFSLALKADIENAFIDNSKDLFYSYSSQDFSVSKKEDTNKVFKDTLKDTPIELYLFETGEKCMEKFKEVKPEVVILDYQLNSVYSESADGIQVMDWIKKENPKTNVIILTNNDNMDIAVKAKQHGASDYVVKTETQFKKINYSLSNIFRILEANRNVKDMKKFIYLFGAIVLTIALLFILLQKFFPGLLVGG